MITAWQRCLERLQAELPVEEYLTWLKPLQAHGDDNSLVLYAPNQFVADTVRERHLERLNELLPHFAGGNPTLRIAVGAVPRPVVASSPSAPSSAKRVAEGANGGRGLPYRWIIKTAVPISALLTIAGCTAVALRILVVLKRPALLADPFIERGLWKR